MVVYCSNPEIEGMPSGIFIMNGNPNFFSKFLFPISSIFCIRFRLEGAIWVMHNNYSELCTETSPACQKMYFLILEATKEKQILKHWRPWMVALDVLNCISPPQTCIDFEAQQVSHLWEAADGFPCCIDWHLGLPFQNVQSFGLDCQQNLGSIQLSWIG